LHAVILATLSCQQPPLFVKHSFVSTSVQKIRRMRSKNKSTWHISVVLPKLKISKHLPLLKQTAGSVVSSNPEQIAFRTAPFSSLPRYCLLLTTSVGNIVTSPRDPFPIYKTSFIKNLHINLPFLF
jgi:hypothetical protein